ncbi:hypothetical protein [Wenyingzhuangia sp. 2_MG-2023]|nr:hypothetical protein [Wenyingzhuangia sp. 2_MG-2023]MDO6736556.1 hypothetical protein [Wenyingzhuangia sp. 2_MG-2023]MDO6801149.1 hypothetical protein [Wenyingzhuangia sp. 1_MG-2023]
MKKSILSILAIAALTFTSCSDDDSNGGGSIKDGIISSDADVVAGDLHGTVEGNITLTKGTDYLLTGALLVKDGYTLTIEAGTTVKVDAGRTDTYVAIEQGAKIMAVGTAAEPILFTSNSATPAAGDWGGIVIAGKTQTNKGDSVQSEVAGLNYGESAAEAVSDDNSGRLSYVIAEYTGAKINGDAEFNGFSFYTVGSGTTLDHLVVKYGFDDGVEFFGGTVDLNGILCVNIADDMFDFTGGFTGTITNAFGVREADFDTASKDPRGIEGDSNESDENATPRSTPTFEGVTIINFNTTTELKAGAEIRRGTEATINNIAFIATTGAQFGNLIDTDDSSGNGSVTLTNAYKMGTVGDNNVGGTITGDVTEDTTIFNEATGVVKAGIGADFSIFSWSGYTIPTVAIN